MAKKGGVQQLQTEINTNDELAKFLDRDGLIVLDVFTEWCGPCLAMVGSLKKIKLEQGGDDLHLAVVKCDKIDVFERFRNKSEPTWLLASKGKLVNCAFGANVPHLIELILKELDTERRIRSDPQSSDRIYYELNEMTPTERERYDAAQKIEEDNERIEKESAQRRRIDYITFVTDSIMENSSDMGVTVLMPHIISRDLLKRLSDPADKCQLVAKDKKTVQILREHIDTLDLCATDSMPQQLLDHIINRDVFVVCWKVTDTNIDIAEKSVEDYLGSFAHLVWNEEQTTYGNVSILKALSVVIETEINDDDDEMNEDNDETEQVKPIEEVKGTNKQETNEDEKEGNDDKGEIDQSESTTDGQDQSQTNKSEENHTETERNTQSTPSEDTDVSGMKSKAGSRCSERSTPISRFASYFKAKRRKEIKIPPIWTPTEKRANAALIYLYFRSMTELYLPPDPPVERPHLAIRKRLIKKIPFRLLTEAKKIFTATGVPKQVTTCFNDITKQLRVEYKRGYSDDEHTFMLVSICLRRLQSFEMHLKEVLAANEKGAIADTSNLMALATHIVNVKPINSGDSLDQHKVMVLLSEIVYRLYVYTRVLSASKMKMPHDLTEFCTFFEKK
ncbi:uncharacterized protein LOC116343675 [Contarinia nasturtii]|uniref:uncharacterized protein LOC116343675 n=1 Tax=Contarinia nasturtii TaxID=265458 RepID=UPI0012D39D2A|nr:uncharacterized protein LOC116343675 [Contarinia nasturtii]